MNAVPPGGSLDRTSQTDARERPLTRLAFFSLLGGSTSLLPLPLVDDWALSWVRRRLIWEMCQPGIAVGESALQILLDRGEEKERTGCTSLLLRTPIGFLFYLLRRLFRKLFFFLAIKESTDRAAELFVEGYLLSSASESGRLHRDVVRGELRAVRQLAFAVVETLQATDTSPVRVVIVQVSRGSRWLLFAAARKLRRLLKRSGDAPPEAVVAEEERVLREPARRLADLLREQWPFLRDLEGRFHGFAVQRRVIVD